MWTAQKLTTITITLKKRERERKRDNLFIKSKATNLSNFSISRSLKTINEIMNCGYVAFESSIYYIRDERIDRIKN